MLPTALLLDRIYERHATGPGHPESPERYEAVTRSLTEGGLVDRMTRITPRDANDDDSPCVTLVPTSKPSSRISHAEPTTCPPATRPSVRRAAKWPCEPSAVS